jgi:serine/threonine-protein kinase
LLPSLNRNSEALVRFAREAELLASLHHPHVVEIIDWDTLPDGSPFMVLEFLHGAHIRVRIDRAAMPWEAIARIGDQTMSALQLAHRIGITHRDLKPENIFISIDDAGDERVKLLDFGVSKLRSAGRTTGEFAMLGTPSYMSPEQAQGQTDSIGPSTDVWAMGAILYEMATQRVAFTGETLAVTVTNITSGRPEPMASLRPDAPAAFIELVDRAISLEPERRITTIEELRAGLKSALETRLRATTPVGGMPVVKPVTAPIQVLAPSPLARASSPPLRPGAMVPAFAVPASAVQGVTTHTGANHLPYWIIGTTAVVALVAMLLVAVLN